MQWTKWRSLGLVGCLLGIWLAGGCGSLRFAPGQEQKQNAYLHHRTVQAAAMQAQEEDSSQVLQQLTAQASRQSEAIVAHYGLPRELPSANGPEEILSAANGQLTLAARAQAIERPDPWDVADHLLELGIALAGVVGGVYGGRALGLLQLARQKSVALREVVQGNELFKRHNPTSGETFKQAHVAQSAQTRALVASLK